MSSGHNGPTQLTRCRHYAVSGFFSVSYVVSCHYLPTCHSSNYLESYKYLLLPSLPPMPQEPTYHTLVWLPIPSPFVIMMLSFLDSRIIDTPGKLPLPSNLLERSSARSYGLITGYFIRTMHWEHEGAYLCVCNSHAIVYFYIHTWENLCFWREIRMSAQADTKGPDIFNFVLATPAHLAKIGVKSCVVTTCHGHIGDICS